MKYIIEKDKDGQWACREAANGVKVRKLVKPDASYGNVDIPKPEIDLKGRDIAGELDELKNQVAVLEGKVAKMVTK